MNLATPVGALLLMVSREGSFRKLKPNLQEEEEEDLPAPAPPVPAPAPPPARVMEPTAKVRQLCIGTESTLLSILLSQVVDENDLVAA